MGAKEGVKGWGKRDVKSKIRGEDEMWGELGERIWLVVRVICIFWSYIFLSCNEKLRVVNESRFFNIIV